MLRVSAFSGSAACDEVADQIGDAERDDEPGEERRVLEPLAGS